MNVPITGGCGFIGLRLAARLLGLGHSVFLFDIHSKPQSTVSSLDEAHYIHGNITCQPHIH